MLVVEPAGGCRLGMPPGVGDVDVARHVERSGVGHRLGLAVAVHREAEVHAERARPQQQDHADRGQDEGRAALVMPAASGPTEKRCWRRARIYELGVDICRTLVDEIVEGVMTPRPGISGKSGDEA